MTTWPRRSAPFKTGAVRGMVASARLRIMSVFTLSGKGVNNFQGSFRMRCL